MLRGGGWTFGASSLEATNRALGNTSNEFQAWGFRVGVVPTPAGAAVMALGAIAARRRRA